MHMYRIASLIVLTAFVISANAEPSATSAAVATNKANEIVARVGSAAIHRRELDMAMHGIQMQMAQQGRGVPKEFQARFEHDVLEEMIGRELLLQDCQGKELAGVDAKVKEQLAETQAQVGGEDALRKALAETGVSLEEYTKRLRDNVLIQAALEKLVEQNVKLGATEAREFYDANAARFKQPETVRASHILITVPQDASEEVKAAKRVQIEAARALVKGGEKFADVARKVSECPSGKQGGDLGPFSRGKMVPEFEIAAFALKTNELSEVVTTPFGYHLMLVTEHKPAEQQSFEKMQADIEKMLKYRKGSELARNHMMDLRAKGKVEVLLPPLPAEKSGLPAGAIEPAPAKPINQ